MLELKVQDDKNEVTLQFEHSLLSLSKWESKYKKAFMATPTKTHEEMIDYFGFMLLTPGVEPSVVYKLTPKQLDELSNYINDPMSASSVPSTGQRRPSGETVTTELVYYWMTALKINWEAQHWHYNRLMMLIAITNFKQQPAEKQDKSKLYDRWKSMNKTNKEKFGTTG